MRHLSTAITIAVFGLALSRQAHAAAILYTSPVDGLEVTLNCDAVNTRSTPVAITIETYDWSGALQDSVTNSALQPGGGISMPSPFGRYCKFKVGGPKSSVAAMAVYSSNVTGNYVTAELAR